MKLNATLCFLMKNGLQKNDLKSLTSVKINKLVVLPRSLFASEFLQFLSSRDRIPLEKIT